MNRKLIAYFLIILLGCLPAAPAARAADLRSVYRQVAESKAESARQKAEQSQRIRLRKEDLKQTQARLRTEVAQLERRITEQQQNLSAKQREVERLQAEQIVDDELMTNLTASVRISAKQLQEILIASPFTALEPDRPERLNRILDANHFPGLDDLEVMVELFETEMEYGAQVNLAEADFFAGDGSAERGRVLLAGPFVTVQLAAEIPQLLDYNPAKRSLSLLDLDLPRGQQRILREYLNGEEERLPLDLANGAALQQLARQKGVIERVQEGGVLVWPILLLAVAAIFISLERVVFLKRVHDNTDRTMNEVNRRAASGDWDGCRRLIEGRKTPVYNVVRAGLTARHEGREVLESVLQEAILKELPRLERALPLLNIMGAVAPLLGLLGTVTGMIGTFEVINIHGTGDPRLMSG
ncbi:MAG: DUF3450 family protein, partial [Deltaproteobacteria bacterium]|nr:DUF3450 family protein [Deltaproteobacteria bacterium]